MPSITAVILAGGLGTRLQSTVKNMPKVLAPVNGRPFLSYILDQMVDSGINEVVICIGYLGNLIVKEFGDRYKELIIRYSSETQALGTGGAIRQALMLVGSGSILAINGDSYCKTDLKSYIDWHFNNHYQASLLLIEVEDTKRYGSVKVDNNCKVISYQEKNTNGGPGWINSGIYIFDKNLLSQIPGGAKFSLEHEFMPNLISKGLHGKRVQAEFIDIGTPESYLAADKFFSKG